MAAQITAMIYPTIVEDLGELSRAIRTNMPGLNFLPPRHAISAAGPETHIFVINATAAQKSGMDQIVAAMDKRPVVLEARPLL